MANFKQILDDIKWAAIGVAAGTFITVYGGYEFIFNDVIVFWWFIPVVALGPVVVLICIVWGIITLVKGAFSLGKGKAPETN